MTSLKRIKSYLTVSPIGYSCTATNAISLINTYFSGNWGTDKTMQHVLCLIMGLGVSYLHISSYRRVRDSLEQNGYVEERAKKKMRTWCGRNVLRVACSETGHLDQFRRQCKEEGYGWYHLLPRVSFK